VCCREGAATRVCLVCAAESLRGFVWEHRLWCSVPSSQSLIRLSLLPVLSSNFIHAWRNSSRIGVRARQVPWAVADTHVVPFSEQRGVGHIWRRKESLAWLHSCRCAYSLRNYNRGR
jgi:hypothetical protein